MANYHTSIRTLPVWNFYEILNTGKLEPLFIGEPDPKATVEEMDSAWKNIYNDYCKVAKIDNRHLKQIAKVEELKLKAYKITGLLSLTKDHFPEVRHEAKEALKGYNYLFRTDKPFKEEFERLQTQLRALKTKISIEEGKLPKADKKEAVNLMKQVVALEEISEGNWKVDIYTTPVEKWIAYWERAKEKINAQKEARKK